MVYVDDDQGMAGLSAPSISEETQQKVDEEIRRILDRQYALARSLLEANRDKVEVMTKALLEWETLDADQVKDIMSGGEPRPPKYGTPEKKPVSSGPIAPSAPATV